jgi:hypothetical protein
MWRGVFLEFTGQLEDLIQLSPPGVSYGVKPP